MSSYRILVGDVREKLRELEDGSVHCVVTSPPYNQLGQRVPENPTGMHRHDGWLKKVREHGYEDTRTESEYVEWQVSVAESLARVARPGASFFYNHKIRYRDKVPIHPIDLVRAFPGWSLRQEIVWDRGGAFAFNARMFAPSDERVFWLVRDGGDHAWNQRAASFLTVWRIHPGGGPDWHPCPFPVELAQRCIVATTTPGDVVLDPFMGAGTTGVACMKLDRDFIGIELNPEYAAMAERRIVDAPMSLFAAGGAA